MNIKSKTNIGRVRDINEDFILTHILNEGCLLIVADGMGGHNAGEIASEIAAETIRDFTINNIEGYDSIEELIRDAILLANNKIFEMSMDSEKLKGMGTTVTCGIINRDKLYLGHVGDSRCYLIHENTIIKITEDHSFVQELINNGSITEDEALNHPQRNLITRAVGVDKYVVIDTVTVDIKKDDIVFLCSDGLTSYVSDGEIKKVILENNENPHEELIDLANQRGGKDNISIIIARREEIL